MNKEIYKHTNFKEWDEIQEQIKQQIVSRFTLNRRTEKRWNRIKKYGYPKKCPIIKKINSLIIFNTWANQ